MNKGVIVAGVAVLAGVAYVGSSWYVGQQAEAKIRTSIEQTNQEFVMLGGDLTSRGMQLSVKEYKRGIFSADAVYALTLANSEEGEDPVELLIADHLQHGPFPLDTLKAGDFTPMLAYSQAHLLSAPAIQVWFDSQKEKSPLQAVTRIGMDGTGSSAWTFSPVEYKKDGTEISFSGGRGHINFSNDFKDSVSTGQFDGLRLLDGSDDSILTMSGLAVNGTAKREGDNTTVNSLMTLDKLALAGDEELSVDKIAVTMDSTQIGKLLDGSIHYQVGKLTIAKADLGSVDLTFGAKNLDTVVLSDIINAYEKMQGGQGNAVVELDSEQEALLQEKLFTMLASKPTLFIDPVVWKNSAGESKASLSVNLAAPTDPEAVQTNPIAALNQMLTKLQLNINVSRAMFVEAVSQVELNAEPAESKEHAQELAMQIYDQYVSEYQEKGFLTVTDDGAALSVLFQDGKITLNDQEMPVEQLMMLMMLLAM